MPSSRLACLTSPRQRRHTHLRHHQPPCDPRVRRASDQQYTRHAAIWPARHEDTGLVLPPRFSAQGLPGEGKGGYGDVDALLDRAEEGVKYDDERAVYRHACEIMEWSLVLTRRFVRRHRRRGNWRVIGFPL